MKSLLGEEIIKGGGQRTAILNIVQCLFRAEIQGHLTHLQAVGRSYAVHMALNEFYQAIPDLRDELTEKYQGKYSILTGFRNVPLADNLEPIPFLKECLSDIETNRKSVNDGYLQQLIDNCIEQFASTLYKLINLH